ncbi:MAG: hypothetical protein BAA01_09350 [Bacillus thermozeamaize]|uniref:Uncharacterized protein n=1 Tax=Bacillus thermozeamaize TaxID=230954 RepID=A0A1Y3PHS7_9BACI|nr:MAG: hypothetical protein BAA01_09350 [Bacillus thermozeamaize]
MSMVNERRIETEEQYQKSLQWLVEKAQLIEHPLLDEQSREKLLRQYDFVASKVIEYRRNRSPKEKRKEEISDWLDD